MDERRPSILFADAELGWSDPLRKRLRERGLIVDAVSTARDLLDRVQSEPPELVVLGEGLDDLGDQLLAGLVEARSPATRIIRVQKSSTRRETKGGSDVLRAGRASPGELMGLIEKVLADTSRLKPPVIVCVDDDPLFLSGLERILLRDGYTVMSYTDPEAALEELPLVKPDLILLDVLMPGLSGFEVLDEVRRHYSPSPPIVLLSGVAGDELADRGRRHGAACYLTKPCGSDSLLEVVGLLLKAPRSSVKSGGKGRRSGSRGGGK